MPEGPEVRILAEYLHKKYVGCIITGYLVVSKFKLKGTIPQARYMIDTIISYGKSILFYLYNQDSMILMESKLAMEGKWLSHPGPYTKLILSLERHYSGYILEEELYYDDMRNFGSLTFHHSWDNRDIQQRVGFDLLEYAIQNQDDIPSASSNLYPIYLSLLQKAKEHDITWFLMNQKLLSGIGNYLKAEILYASRIHPQSKASTIAKDQALTIELINHSLNLILRSYRSGGLTIRTYISPSGIKGTFDTLVYNHQYDPNGYKVLKGEFQDKRTTHYCPEIQTLGV